MYSRKGDPLPPRTAGVRASDLMSDESFLGNGAGPRGLVTRVREAPHWLVEARLASTFCCAWSDAFPGTVSQTRRE